MDDRLKLNLDRLVSAGMIESYKLVNVDQDGKEDVYSDNRNTERLTLNFPNGKKLVIGTFCSGSSENTVLLDEDY